MAGKTALVVVDMLNTYDFEDAEKLTSSVEATIDPLDTHVRHHDVTVPRKAVAHIHEHLADAALEMMGRNMGAELA